MGIRDIVLGLIIFAAIPLAVWRPFFGLLVFSWLAYMRAPDMTWVVPQYHPSLWIAVATVIGVFVHKEERLFVLEKRTILLGLFFATVGVSAALALNPDPDPKLFGTPDAMGSFRRGELMDLGKIVFIALLTTGLVRTQDRARYLMLTIAGSLGLLALKTMAQGIQSPGTIMHGPGGAIGDNNDYGLALVMALPLLVFLARDEESFLTKAILVMMSIACIGGVLLTRSRGGVIALTVLAICWLISSRRNAWTFILMPLAVALVLVLTPPELFERIRGLLNGANDASSHNRVVAWQKALAMAQDNPAFGIGPGNFQGYWAMYPPDELADHPLVAHNTYLQILAESGVVAIFLYVTMIVVTLVALLRTRREGPEPWRMRYAHAVFLSLIGFLAGSFFLSRTHFDLVYHLIGISVALRVVRGGEAFDWFGLRKRKATAYAVEGAPGA
jgi:probable O-glycosylation ligase (exosortase A-associated)